MAAQIRVLRRRIRSTQSIKKITRAMELIATSRIVKARARVEESRPYAQQITAVLTELASNSALDHPLLVERSDPRRAAVLVVTSDRGQCGGYNLNVLKEAEALLPIKSLGPAKASLRSIQERWESVGKVPRNDIQRIEKRLKAVEQAIRERDDDKWRRSNPETKARAEGALGQLRDSIAGLENELAQARSAKDARKVKDAETALAARRAWLTQLERTANDFR